MSIAKPSPTYLLARALPILFSYTAALCFGYFVLAALAGGVPFIAHPFSLAIEILGVIEIAWYLIWFLPYRSFLQRKQSAGEGVGRGGGKENREERRETLLWALDHTPDLEEFLRGWMNRAHVEDIRRDNIKEWLLWWLFGRDDNDGGKGLVDDKTDAELDEYIWELETRLGVGFRPGRSDDAKPLRLGVDSVEMSHRSLVYYGLIGMIDFASTTFLLLKGFSFYRQGLLNSFLATFPFRPFPLLLTPNVSAATSLSYFYRRHTSPIHRPVVFLHGAGVGLAPYLAFLTKIPNDVGVIAIEILPLSNRISIPTFSFPSLLLSSRPPTSSTLDLEVEQEKLVADEFQRILDQHGTDFDDFVLVAHSFGSLLLAPILARRRTAQSIDSVVLIDPVAVLCHLPDVAYNFLRRAPTTASEWATWWFASQDPMIAHTLARQWWSGPGDWRATAMWREQLVGKRTTVILGSEDVIIPSKAIASYIFYGDVNYHEQTAQRVEEWRASVKRWTGARKLELLYMEGLNHGQALLLSSLPTIQHVVDMYCYRDKVVSATLEKLREMI